MDNNDIWDNENLQYKVATVSSDGEPHGLMTMIAVVSGTIVAVIILFTLAIFVECCQKKSFDKPNTNDDDDDKTKKNNKSKRPNLNLPIFAKRKTFDISVIGVDHRLSSPDTNQSIANSTVLTIIDDHTVTPIKASDKDANLYTSITTVSL